MHKIMLNVQQSMHSRLLRTLHYSLMEKEHLMNDIIHNDCTGSAQWGNLLHFKSIQCHVHYSSNHDIREEVELLIEKLIVDYTQAMLLYSTVVQKRCRYIVNANQ